MGKIRFVILILFLIGVAWGADEPCKTNMDTLKKFGEDLEKMMPLNEERPYVVGSKKDIEHLKKILNNKDTSTDTNLLP